MVQQESTRMTQISWEYSLRHHLPSGLNRGARVDLRSLNRTHCCSPSRPVVINLLLLL